MKRAWTPWMAAGLAILFAAGSAEAARIRYHYAPDGNGVAVLTLAVPGGAPGERLSLFGRRSEPYNCAPRTTCCVSLTHACTGRPIQLPLAMPADSTPRIEYRPNGLSYNYGSDSIDITFVSDGTVDVIYNSGLFRAP